MLKLRTSSMDEALLRDLKAQAGDLLADPSKFATSSTNEDDDDEEGIAQKGRFVGELRGEFNTVDNKGKRPIKFNIIDLGPILEMSDELAGGPQRRVGKPGPEDGKRGAQSAQLESTPLTENLAQIAKLFMKFSVARTKPKAKVDEVALYLNGNQFDEGDGYMCGTFSQLGGGRNGTEATGGVALVQDDFSMEVAILDELFERIERAPLQVGTVDLVEGVMTMGTLAPARVEPELARLPPALRRTRRPSSSTTTGQPEPTPPKGGRSGLQTDEEDADEDYR